jgi:PadR family transcriptional regulator, regulatory protein AphA
VSIERPSRGGNLSPEFAILGFLFSGPLHGYDLHQRFRADLGHVWHVSQSQLYAILKRLEGQGALSAHVIHQQELPDRRVLRMTASGRRRFLAWLELEVSSNARSIRLEFLTRLYFVRRFRPEKSQQVYDAQREEVEGRTQHLKNTLAAVPDDQVFNRLSLDLRIKQMQLIIRWLDDIKILVSHKEAVR